jgi:hypothetical protein
MEKSVVSGVLESSVLGAASGSSVGIRAMEPTALRTALEKSVVSSVLESCVLIHASGSSVGIRAMEPTALRAAMARAAGRTLLELKAGKTVLAISVPLGATVLTAGTVHAHVHVPCQPHVIALFTQSCCLVLLAGCRLYWIPMCR